MAESQVELFVEIDTLMPVNASSDGGAVPPISTTTGMNQFRRASKYTVRSIGEATDLISAQSVDANDSNYNGLALAA